MASADEDFTMMWNEIEPERLSLKVLPKKPAVKGEKAKVGRFVILHYDDQPMDKVQLPRASLAFHMINPRSSPEDEAAKTSWTVELNIDTPEFRTVCDRIDAKVVSLLAEKSPEIWGTKKDAAAVAACAGVRMGKLFKDPTPEDIREYNKKPEFRVKIKKVGGPLVQRCLGLINGQMEVEDSTAEVELKAHTVIESTVQFTGLWVSSAGWGINVVADQIVAFPQGADKGRKRMRIAGVSDIVVKKTKVVDDAKSIAGNNGGSEDGEAELAM
jgi:hypothetical protein